MRTYGLLGFVVLLLTVLLSACSKSETGSSDGSGGASAPTQLNWDQGNWNKTNWQ